MRILLLVLMTLFIVPSYSSAMDQYHKSNVKWEKTIKLNRIVEVRSVNKISKRNIKMMKRTFRLTKRLFFEYWNIEPYECNLRKFHVKVVRDHFDLDNREYFPGETDYAEGEYLMFERYYRYFNTLYVVPPDNNLWNWDRDFAHEVLHYLFDECGVKFPSDHAEHREIDDFLHRYRSKY